MPDSHNPVQPHNDPDPEGQGAARNLRIPVSGQVPDQFLSEQPVPPRLSEFPTFEDLVVTPDQVRRKIKAYFEFMGAELVALGDNATPLDIMQAGTAWFDFIRINVGNANPVVPWHDPSRTFVCRCGQRITSTMTHECDYVYLDESGDTPSSSV